MTKGVFRRVGMTAVAAGNTGRDALMSVPDGARFTAEIGPDVRSRKSHSHYFASLTEYWQNLPEDLGDDFPTVEHLRKWALIKAGYRDDRKFVASDIMQAREMAGFMRPLDSYSIFSFDGCVVTCYTAHSQSIKAMGNKDFQASKTAVLEIVAKLVGAELPSRPAPPLSPPANRQARQDCQRETV